MGFFQAINGAINVMFFKSLQKLPAQPPVCGKKDWGPLFPWDHEKQRTAAGSLGFVTKKYVPSPSQSCLQSSWHQICQLMMLAMPETWVLSLGWEDPLEKGTATFSSILAQRIPWTG